MASVGYITLEKTKKYIENQKAHHVKNNLFIIIRILTLYGWGASIVLFFNKYYFLYYLNLNNMMRGAGFEPAQALSHQVLSFACLYLN